MAQAAAPNSGNPKGIVLLSLDGGGIKGLSVLMILKEIFNRVAYDEGTDDSLRPFNYFDLIGGTGTGGLIAILLGPLKMTIEQAIGEYIKLTESVFSDEHKRNRKYDEKVLKDKLQMLIGRHAENPNVRMIQGKDQKCKSFLCAAMPDNFAHPVLFRTYRTRSDNSIDCTIWEAVQASMASPTLFRDAVKIVADIGEVEFIDGAFRCNNPTRLVVDEAKKQFPGRPLTCILNIGSGYPKIPSLKQESTHADEKETMLGIARDCEAVVEEMQKKYTKSEELFLRLSVSQGMQKMDMDKWLSEKYSVVCTHTMQYMQEYHTDQMINRVVTMLREKPARFPTY